MPKQTIDTTRGAGEPAYSAFDKVNAMFTEAYGGQIPGMVGATGSTGPRGASVTSGTGTPSAAGQTGDVYIDTATGDLWRYN